MKNISGLWFAMAAICAVMAVQKLASQQSWMEVVYWCVVAVWFAGLGLLYIWCKRKGPQMKRFFQWTTLISTVVMLLVVMLLLR